MSGGPSRADGGALPLRPIATVPSAYPDTTVASDTEVAVDTSQARTIVLAFALSESEVVLIDAGDAADTHNITVSVASGKKLNGTVDGTVTIATKGALRGFKRDALGAWRGGV